MNEKSEIGNRVFFILLHVVLGILCHDVLWLVLPCVLMGIFHVWRLKVYLRERRMLRAIKIITQTPVYSKEDEVTIFRWVFPTAESARAILKYMKK